MYRQVDINHRKYPPNTLNQSLSAVAQWQFHHIGIREYRMYALCSGIACLSCRDAALERVKCDNELHEYLI